MTDKPIDIVTLGNSGIRASYLAFGTGTRGYSHSSAQTRKDPQWLTNALVKSYDAGINFWDLADLYGSHPFAKKALEAFEREQVVIMTKTMAKDADGCRHDIDRFLEELGTDYLDIVLMHGKTSGNWAREDRGVMDVLSEAKKRGVIRAVGISAHSYRALETAVREPWVDIMLVRYNYSGVQMDGDPGEIEKVMQAAQKNGKGTVAMKVLGEDALASDPEKAIRFVAQTDCVNAMTIGYQSDEELAQCIAIVKTIRQS